MSPSHTHPHPLALQQTRARLVEDLVPLILESNDHHWWPRDLVRFAQVSPAWLSPIRRRLYKSLVLSSFAQCAQLVHALRNNPDLIRLVEAIDLRPKNVESCWVHGDEVASVHAILGLPSIKSLTVGGELVVKAENQLRLISPSLQELVIDGWTGDESCPFGRSRSNPAPASLVWDADLAYHLRNVKKLTLRHLDLHICIPTSTTAAPGSPGSFAPYPMNLEELVLDRVNITGGDLAHLAHGSWASLKALHILARSNLEADDHLRRTLALTTSLESLIYEVRDEPRRGDESIFDVQLLRLATLRHLRLSNIGFSCESLALVKDRFPNLESLAVLGRSARVSAEEWASFLGTNGALPKLRTLTPPNGTQAPPFRYWNEEARRAIYDACAQRGVDVEITRLPYIAPRAPSPMTMC